MIVHPFKPRMKVFVCLLLIVAIWIISVSISLPLAIYQKVRRSCSKRNFFSVSDWCHGLHWLHVFAVSCVWDKGNVQSLSQIGTQRKICCCQKLTLLMPSALTPFLLKEMLTPVQERYSPLLDDENASPSCAVIVQRLKQSSKI